MSTGYTIGEDGRSITCLICGSTSHNLNDVAHRYCGRCHFFHGPSPEAFPVIAASTLDGICKTLLERDPAAKAVLVAIIHPNNTIEPVLAARAEEFRLGSEMARCLRLVADEIESVKTRNE